MQDLGERPLDERLHDFLRDRTMLLVLDNVEQVLPIAPALAALLVDCPAVTLLVTSRALLRVSGEHGFPVAPLALPESGPATLAEDLLVEPTAAIRLFAARTRAIVPDFTLSAGNVATVVEICRRLDGLPLAIELAAARGNVLSPPALLSRLDRRLPLLTEGARDLPTRLRTMRDAIAWSDDLLSPGERALFRRLAIFAGGCTLAAAEAVAPDPAEPVADVLAGISTLVDASLLRRHDEPDGEPRFQMLETVREYGLDQLAANGELAAVGRRHAEWATAYIAQLQRSGALSGARGLIAVAAEQPNLRAALTWLVEQGKVEPALRLAGLLAEVWLRHGHLAEGVAWLERLLALDTGPPTAARANALVGLNMLLWPRDEFDRAARLLAEAEAVAHAAGDARSVAYVRLHQGYLASFRGEAELAVARAAEVLPFFESAGDFVNLNGALWLLAQAALTRRDDQLAAAHYERLLATARGWGDEISLANGLLGQAILAERRREMATALTRYAEAAAVCLGFGDRWGAGHGLEGAATAAFTLGKFEPAVRLLAAVDALRRTVGAAPLPVFTVDRPTRAKVLADARAALGSTRFDAAWTSGGALSFAAAIAEADALAASAIDHDPGRRPGGDTARFTPLTARQREVLKLLAEGWSDKDIAAALSISRETASKHVAAIRAKLAVPSRTAAVAAARRSGLA
jgi:non-specific serine/threonine protein kinase